MTTMTRFQRRVQALERMGRFCVVYRKGGTNNFSWHRSAPMPSLVEALDADDSVSRSGYLSHVEDYDRSVRLGLPETYEAQHPVLAFGPRDGDRPSPFVTFPNQEAT